MRQRESALKSYFVTTDDPVDINISISNVTLNTTVELKPEASVDIPSWLPGVPLSLDGIIRVDVARISEQLHLHANDKFFLLFTIESRLTHRIFEHIFDVIAPTGSFLHNINLPIDVKSIGGTLEINCTLLVDPVSNVLRELGSPSGDKSTIWEKEYSAVLQREGALANVTRKDLKGALWAFQFDIPEDAHEWLDLEWNDAVAIFVDADRTEDIHASSEMKALLISDLITRILTIIFERENSLEIISEFNRYGTFVTELFKILRTYLNFKPNNVDLVRFDWNSTRNEI